MKLLFDQNLSHKLPKQLADQFPGSEHVRVVGLEHASDEEIWEYSRSHGFAIVTQDADFSERSRLVGSPPKVIWLRCGNTSTRNLENVLRANVGLIQALEHADDQHALELVQ